MKIHAPVLLATVVFGFVSTSHCFAASVDWAQPPVACAEDIVPEMPNRPCLDLSVVVDPLKDLPALLPAELVYWQTRKGPLTYCRANEVLRRGKEQPGSQTPVQIENAWMQSIAVQHTQEKRAAVYAASRANQIPAQVLAGAVYQESLFSELGIAEDGANYSCGVGQINIIEWCHWADAADSATKKKIGWPLAGSGCADLSPALVAPFYTIALSRLNGLPDYRLTSKQFAGISQAEVEDAFPSGAKEVQKRRFEGALSFINHCSDPTFGIAAKANELASLYNHFVPAGLKTKDIYKPGDRFARRCQDKGFEGAYPLNTGWLLAVGMYNAGPRALDQLAYYNGWTFADLAEPSTFDGFTPPDLITGFYWGGRYRASDDLIHVMNLSGADASWTWIKPCILQRHIARVIQHATLVTAPPLADSLEAPYKCAKSVFDVSSGALVTSAVPPIRQKSSGVAP